MSFPKPCYYWLHVQQQAVWILAIQLGKNQQCTSNWPSQLQGQTGFNHE